MAKSIRLSTRFQRKDGEYQSLEALKTISVHICHGEPFLFNQAELDALLAEKALLDKGLSATDIAKVVFFIIALLVPAVIGALFLWLR